MSATLDVALFANYFRQAINKPIPTLQVGLHLRLRVRRCLFKCVCVCVVFVWCVCVCVYVLLCYVEIVSYQFLPNVTGGRQSISCARIVP